MKIKNNKGFTLIELLVVVAILGLLATIVAVSLTGARSRARDGRRVSDLRQIELALELYYAAHREYPTTNVYSDLINEGYLNMATAPRDPSTGNPYCYSYGDKLDADPSSDMQYYHVGAVLENSDSDLLQEDKDFTGTDTSAVDWVAVYNASLNNADCPGTTHDFYGDCGNTGQPGICNQYGDDTQKPTYDRSIVPSGL